MPNTKCQMKDETSQQDFQNKRTCSSYNSLNWKFGKCKNYVFQKEYRFVITVLPWGVNELLELLYNTKNNFGQFLLDDLQNNTPKVSSLDIELNSQILDNSNILFGPKCSDTDKNEIIELIKSLGLNTTYANSKIKIN